MKPSQTANTRYHEAADQFAHAMQRLARATEANAERRLDLLQDMHFQLWKSLSAFDGRCSLKTWVYRVIHNVAASHVDRERRRPVMGIDFDELDQMPGLTDLSGLVERDDALARLHAWIRKLKPTDRQIMTLYLEDLSAAEMSEVTGFKPGAIATRISRLKSKLAQDFKEASK
ncbi:MAG: sigma-70 family RNA polymerase sigma factor [Pseudomonadota bacterium]